MPGGPPYGQALGDCIKSGNRVDRRILQLVKVESRCGFAEWGLVRYTDLTKVCLVLFVFVAMNLQARVMAS